MYINVPVCVHSLYEITISVITAFKLMGNSYSTNVVLTNNFKEKDSLCKMR